MTIELEIKFEIGSTVYLKTDMEQKPRILTSIEVKKCDDGYLIVYILTQSDLETAHNDFEISDERDELLRLG